MSEQLLTVTRATAYIPVSHEMLLDSLDHQCDDACPPPWVPPPISWQRRTVNRLRSVAWRIKRLPGYRLVHRDDIRGWGDDD
jgi:hypothetical protein